MDLDAELLARLRFAFVTATLGLAMGTGALAMILEAMWLATRRLVFRDLYRFWIRIFGLAFALGLFAGLISPHAGVLLDRGLVAGFALQAGGLGVTLAGWRGTGSRLHFTATSIAATGAFLAAFCVLPAYGWFHDIAPGAVLPPNFAARFVHLTLASFLATALLLGAISARTLLADPLRPAARMGLRMRSGCSPSWRRCRSSPVRAFVR
ncbi:cytochrome ubiquinol oxidase subunit I [Caulobacter mirabilis]|nr:cytochrome ubiquinol oxidase subunit I [Caulobacter mirabilis]